VRKLAEFETDPNRDRNLPISRPPGISSAGIYFSRPGPRGLFL